MKLVFRILPLAAALLSLGVRAESLDSTLQSAVALNPLTHGAQVGVELSQARSDQMRGLQWGQLEARVSAGTNNYNGYAPIAPQTVYRPATASLTYSLPLYTSGRLTAMVSAAQHGEAVAVAQRRQVEQQVLLDAGAAYLALAHAYDLAELATHQHQLLTKELTQAQAELKAGLRTRTDVAQAQARVSRALAGVAQADGQVKAAVARYQATVGRQPEGPLSRPPLHFDQSLAAYVDTALAGNPLLTAKAGQVEQARSNYQAVRREYRPSLGLSASVSTDRETNPMLLRESSQALTLQLTLPLFDGRSSARIHEAALQIEQRQADQDALRAEVQAEAVQAWETHHARAAQTLALQDQVTAAEVALQGAKEELKAGTRTLLDVLNAEQERLDARTALLEADYQQAESVLRLHALSGRLAPVGP